MAIETIKPSGLKQFVGGFQGNEIVQITREGVGTYKTTVNDLVRYFGADGYQYRGVATIDTVPYNGTQRVYYEADGDGVYENFGLEVRNGEKAYFLYDGTSWTKETNHALDYLGTLQTYPEYMNVVVDDDNRLIESTDVNGNKTFYGNVAVDGTVNGADIRTAENAEWIKIVCDEQSRIVFGIKRDGTVVIPKLGMERELLTILEDALVRDGFSTGGVNSEQVDVNTQSIKNISDEMAKMSEQISDVKNETLEEATVIANNVAGRKIIYEQLDQSVIDFINISGGGVINNASDGEDLTAKDGVLKFADREYDEGNYTGRGEYILRKELKDGKASFDTSSLKKKNTTIVVRYDFDLLGEQITLAEGVVIKFDGGSFRNGTIVVSDSNEFVSIGQYQCFYNCRFQGEYTKTLPLSMLGVIANGKDCYSALSKLNEILVEVDNTAEKARKPIFPNVSIDGIVKCGKNGVQIPAGVSIKGENSATIDFTSNALGEDYCMSISSRCSLKDITLYNGQENYSGVILMANSGFCDFSHNIYGASEITLDNVTITGRRWVEDKQTYYTATGMKIIADSSNSHGHYTRVKLNNVNIEFVGTGLHLHLQNNAGYERFAWGNEVNADILYIAAMTCGVLQTAKDDNTVYKITDSGYMCINNYEFQALIRGAIGFDISTVKKVSFLRFSSWDNDIFGKVRDGAEVYVMYDKALATELSGELIDETLKVKGGDRVYYNVYKGKLYRWTQQFINE